MTNRMLGMFKRKGDAPEPLLVYALPAAVLVGAALVGSSLGLAVNGLVLLSSALFCVFAIGGLSSQTTANFGNKMGLIGVAGGLLVTTNAATTIALKQQMGIVMGAGAGLGALIANKVAVTDLPQLVAAFHSLVGVAAVATALSSQMAEVAKHSAMVALAWSGKSAAAKAAAAQLMAGAGVDVVHSVTTFLAAVIGSVTLTGSAVAFAKLQGLVSGKPLALPGKRVVNAILTLLTLGAMQMFLAAASSNASMVALYAGTVIAGVLGFLITAGVGGGDMPVVITCVVSPCPPCLSNSV